MAVAAPESDKAVFFGQFTIAAFFGHKTAARTPMHVGTSKSCGISLNALLIITGTTEVAVKVTGRNT